MNSIVCDTGPVLHLREVGLLYLLKQTGRVYIPKAVDNELFEIDSDWKDDRPSWITIKFLPEKEASFVVSLCNAGFLDIGEAEAVVLAQHLKADWLLTDDSSARTFANMVGLEVHGSLGVVLWAAATENLEYEEAKNAIDKLAQTSLWISKTILKKAYNALDEIFG